MIFLILGVVLFFGIHFVPSSPLKPMFIERLGEGAFKGVFSLISLAGLISMIYGFSESSFQPLWTPANWSRDFLIALMPFSIILLCAADIPNNIKRIVRHPMLLGISLWGFGHLIANGDLASAILFTSFAVYSVINIVTVNRRGNYEPPEAVSHRWDLGVVALGLAVFTLLFYIHGWLTGMPLI